MERRNLSQRKKREKKLQGGWDGKRNVAIVAVVACINRSHLLPDDDAMNELLQRKRGGRNDQKECLLRVLNSGR